MGVWECVSIGLLGIGLAAVVIRFAMKRGRIYGILPVILWIPAHLIVAWYHALALPNNKTGWTQVSRERMKICVSPCMCLCFSASWWFGSCGLGAKHL
ncbi:uncharacterized protein VTP21DRAFT_3254 [Calcarisporiella thermophila]|uniref:uncharacterized protein n=1 Tax=Calcarisporiella thermophila TaxID=911321 RepID=UPI003741F012